MECAGGLPLCPGIKHKGDWGESFLRGQAGGVFGEGWEEGRRLEQDGWMLSSIAAALLRSAGLKCLNKCGCSQRA